MQLDKQTRDSLISRISRLLKGNDRNKENNKNAMIRISDLEGLGSEIWKDIDIGQYIRNERQWD